MLVKGDTIPDFSSVDEKGIEITQSDLLDRYTIIYFYPKDNTPGCTIESCDFSEILVDFHNLKCDVFGVSTDSVESHQRFIKKKSLTVKLLSDVSKDLCEKFGVWQEKNTFGKKYMGIVRTTFLIDKSNHVLNIWNNVKVKGHAYEVKRFLEEAQSSY